MSDATLTSDKTLENRVRRKARRLGYGVKKSRTQNIHSRDFGEYALFDTADADGPYPVLGWDHDCSLADIEAWLDEANAGVPEQAPTYVREFLRWCDAGPVQRMQIACEQAAACIDVPDLGNLPEPLAAVMPNGKRLSDCTKEDLLELAEWQRAVAEACLRNADIREKLAEGSDA
jgi:hypothetical protein